MGWFGGDGTSLAAVGPDIRATRIVDGFGGVEGAMDKLRTAYQGDDFRWALELASYILAVEQQNHEARQLKAWSLKALAYASESANERNYLLTQAMMLEGHISLAAMARAGLKRGLPDTYLAADGVGFLHTLGARLNVEKARDSVIRFKIVLNDRAGNYVLDIDRGVLLTSEYGAEDVDFTLSVSHKNLALVCEGLVTWQGLYQSGAVGLEGDKDRFDEVAGLF
jgi:alkyl sulfatase BDS1-like metallo-beta-lactamase superfamily hydrolase